MAAGKPRVLQGVDKLFCRSCASILLRPVLDTMPQDAHERMLAVVACPEALNFISLSRSSSSSGLPVSAAFTVGTRITNRDEKVLPTLISLPRAGEFGERLDAREGPFTEWFSANLIMTKEGKRRRARATILLCRSTCLSLSRCRLSLDRQ